MRRLPGQGDASRRVREGTRGDRGAGSGHELSLQDSYQERGGSVEQKPQINQMGGLQG